jgi:hypothetical protein
MVGMCHRCTGGRLMGWWEPMGYVAVLLCRCDHCRWWGFPVDN